MLIILSGLPGTGKTTIAEKLCRDLGAVHVRIDTIEQALRSAGGFPEGSPAGYSVGYAIAEDNLRLGRMVVADSVNPVSESRRGWRNVGLSAGVATLEVEIICSDVSEHRHRVEARTTDVAGLVKPSWRQVEERIYEPWQDPPDLVLDTAAEDAKSLVRKLADRVRLRASQEHI